MGLIAPGSGIHAHQRECREAGKHIGSVAFDRDCRGLRVIVGGMRPEHIAGGGDFAQAGLALFAGMQEIDTAGIRGDGGGADMDAANRAFFVLAGIRRMPGVSGRAIKMTGHLIKNPQPPVVFPRRQRHVTVAPAIPLYRMRTGA